MKIEKHYAEILRRTGCSPGHLRHRGLTDVLKERFYFDYKFNGRTSGGGGPRQRLKNGGGMARGRVVDHEVQLWIKNAVDPDGEKQKKANPMKQKKKETLHAFSRAFIELMRRMRMRPIGTQVIVRDASCDLATLVDAVFLNERNKIVLVELKCGFEGYNDTSNALLKKPFLDVPNSPRYQHQLQLSFTRQMFHGTFPELGNVDAMLVRMTHSGAHVTPVDSKIEKVVKKIMQKQKKV